MLTVEQITKLKKFFLSVGELESQQEELRVRLCSLPNFNPMYVLRLLDKENKQFITKYDNERLLNWSLSFESSMRLKDNTENTNAQFLDDSGMSSDKAQLSSIMKSIEFGANGWISYEEMLRMILPSTDKAVIKNIKKNKDKPICYSSYVKSLIVNETKLLLEGEMTMRRIIGKHRSQLGIVDEDCCIKVYELAIEKNGLYNFLKLNPEHDSSKQIVNAIIRRINVNELDTVNYESFKAFIQPNSQSDYKSNQSAKPISRNILDKENIGSFTFAMENESIIKHSDKFGHVQSSHFDEIDNKTLKQKITTKIQNNQAFTSSGYFRPRYCMPLNENNDLTNIENNHTSKKTTYTQKEHTSCFEQTQITDRELKRNLSFMRMNKARGTSQDLLNESNTSTKIRGCPSKEYYEQYGMTPKSLQCPSHLTKQLKKPR